MISGPTQSVILRRARQISSVFIRHNHSGGATHHTFHKPCLTAVRPRFPKTANPEERPATGWQTSVSIA